MAGVLWVAATCAGGVYGRAISATTGPPGLGQGWGGECARFEVQRFPTLTEVVEKKGASGEEGGQWTACTHLKIYGLNLATYFLRFLAYKIRPRTVLELGCGLGTTSDYLVRHVPGGASVTCVEPEPMLGEVFNRHPTMRARQLAFNAFEAGSQGCYNQLLGSKFELVLSVEVAEHIPAKHHPNMIKLLAGAVAPGGHLVFSGARKNQGGTGHLPESSRSREEWQALFEAEGLKYADGLSKMAQKASYPDRSYDLFINLLTMRRPAEGMSHAGLMRPPNALTERVDKTLGRRPVKVLEILDRDTWYRHHGQQIESVEVSHAGKRVFFKERPHDVRINVRPHGVAEPNGATKGESLFSLVHLAEEATLFPELWLVYRKLRAGVLKCEP